jgi:hypothetical protein
LHATELDERRPGTRDGTGMLTFFVSFITTQVAALVILAQGKSVAFIVIPILVYLAIAILPIWGISRVLWARETERERNAVRRLYDPGTLHFAKWALVFTLAFAIGLPILGLFNLIPGQDTRKVFSDTFVKCLPPQVGEVLALKGHRNDSVDNWVHKLAKGYEKTITANKRLLVVEQDGTFAENYDTFTAWISFGGNAQVTDGQAFLVRRGTRSEQMPCYDELRLLPSEKSGVQRHVVEVKKPDRDDYLTLFLVVEPRIATEKFPGDEIAGYLFELRVK